MSNPENEFDDVTTLSPDELCLKDRHWYAFLCSSLITFFAGLLFVLTWRIFAWTLCQKQAAQGGRNSMGGLNSLAQGYSKPPDAQIGSLTYAQDWAGGMISGQTNTGRILVVIVFLMSIASLIIYFVDSST
jgi:potassium large conductance calcium-activated channel subfamily M alpha member 1